MTSEHDMWMGLALDLAREAAASREVPVGAVVVKDGRVIGRGANRREADQDPVAHAEILAIAEAANAVGHWRLEGTTLYATLEPCPMCAGAILNARIPLLVYGCDDPKAGAVRSLFTLLDDPRLNHRCEIVAGVRAAECAAILTEFFEGLRAQGKK
ncbi:MAG: tRNA adenosine(34) deaminase TadA [Proteobacteria bacterium]|jgi:tRNA(adenine34) deaminase|nr:tRNA adenosine(34) deaminase TadA [Pseudomonadota bacterium]